jgi:hypothetical protein
MQGAGDILVAITYTYIFEESLAQNAHAENSEYFINQGTMSFLHIPTKKKIKLLYFPTDNAHLTYNAHVHLLRF